MCSRGYENTFSGLCVALLILVGLVGSVIAGIITEKTGKMEEVAKLCACISCLVLAGVLLHVLRKPDMSVAIALLCSV